MIDLPVAVISDVHGNRWALEAVLRDIKRREIYAVVNLGDILYGPLDPAGTARILIDLDMPTVLGNQDRLIIEPPDRQERSLTLDYVVESLCEEHLQWLRKMDMTKVVYENFFLCHGTPEKDDEYLLVDVEESGAVLKHPNKVMEKLSAVAQPVVLCGHDHVPRSITLPDGRLIVDPGSVGLPAYCDELPLPHTMETGTPHARYSIVSKSDEGWWVENIAVPYDWQTASDVALEYGRTDWAKWLRTGRA